MALQVLKDEFRLSRFMYRYHDSRVFYCSHWRLPGPAFLGIQLVMAVYSIYALVYHIVYYELFSSTLSHHSIMVFFTTWSYIALTAHLTLAGLLSALFYRKVNYDRPQDLQEVRTICYRGSSSGSGSLQIDSVDPSPQETTKRSELYGGEDPPFDDVSVNTGNGLNQSAYESIHGDHSYEHVPIATTTGPSTKRTKWFFQISWALADLNVCVAPLVTIIYYTAIYPYLRSKYVGYQMSIRDINVHALNSVFVLVDFIVTTRPIRLYHSWMPMLFGMCWVVFSVVYWSADTANNIVYAFFNWNEPDTALIWSLLLSTMMVVNMILWFVLYRLKIWLYRVVFGKEYFVILKPD